MRNVVLNKVDLLCFKIKKNLIPKKIRSEEYVNYLKTMGISIGQGTYFFSPYTTNVDIQRPWMLKIGEYCKITSGVIILAHDYSRSVVRRKYGEIVGEAKETIIGDNVFIGMNSIICMGSHIGNNVIIGAGSVITGTIPDDSVVGGVPGKVICSLESYYTKRKSRTLDEAILYFHNFQKMYKRNPSESEMGPFFPLFMQRNLDEIRRKNIFTALSGDNEKEILEEFLKTSPRFQSYEEFRQFAESYN